MIGALLAIALLSLITGLSLLFAPQVMIKAGEWFNRLYHLDSYIHKYRHFVGIAFLLLGLVLIIL